ncbi:MAG: hypothetical protein U1F68_00150 [Gammaproteobacteria bacterium]
MAVGTHIVANDSAGEANARAARRWLGADRAEHEPYPEPLLPLLQ